MNGRQWKGAAIASMLLAAILISSCTSSQVENAKAEDILPVTTGGLAGAIGYEAMPGSVGAKLGVAGAAEVAGYSLGELIRMQIGKIRKEAFAEGYNIGERVSPMETNALADRINQTINGSGQPKTTLYSFPADTKSPDGTKYMNHDVVMPVVE